MLLKNLLISCVRGTNRERGTVNKQQKDENNIKENKRMRTCNLQKKKELTSELKSRKSHSKMIANFALSRCRCKTRFIW